MSGNDINNAAPANVITCDAPTQAASLTALKTALGTNKLANFVCLTGTADTDSVDGV